jgi:divinyl protochlorophyllide a 8-vinyl-reductase
VSASVSHAPHIGRIGPNVLIQTANALSDRLGDDVAERLLSQSTAHGLADLPQEMVEESKANALVRAVHEAYGLAFARSVMRESGRRTGDYLLANRIPKPAQWLLPLLPNEMALRVLLAAIGKHTWTFAGSAHVHITAGDPAVITIQHCPLCAGQQSTEPMCDFYAGTFGRIAQALLGPKGWAEEVACEARGESACRFLMGSGR